MVFLYFCGGCVFVVVAVFCYCDGDGNVRDFLWGYNYIFVIYGYYILYLK